jgi:HK97 gp10 family phage protein
MIMSIQLKINGFEDLLKSIEAAGGSINAATESAIKASAQIMESELKSEMQKSRVPSRLINAMPSSRIEKSANRITAHVGYEKGAYDPTNLSDAYKVIFLNYGTPKRSKHGKVRPRGFIQRAKKKANSKIKKEQQAVFEKILRRLQK